MNSGCPGYAIGDFGKLVELRNGEVPSGITVLVEEHDQSLTPAGEKFCKNRALQPDIESIRVAYAQQSSSAMAHAADASVKNQDRRANRDEQTKAMSEKLRLDWEAQDKAYRANETAKKQPAVATALEAKAPVKSAP